MALTKIAVSMIAEFVASAMGFMRRVSGAVQRTVQDKAEDILHASDFGCSPANVDNYANFSAALAAATGRTLSIGSGVYTTSPLVIPNGTRIVGEGQSLTTVKLKAGSNSDLMHHAGAAGSKVTIEKLTLDGNMSENLVGGRSLFFTTDANTDGPALLLRDVVLTNARGGADGASVFINGLCWIHMYNVRFINNGGALWLSTNDATYVSLYVGNSALYNNVPSVIVGGSNNQFLGAYFGGNGDYFTNQIEQVRVWGGSGNFFIGCINDHANGHGYVFTPYQTSESNYNQIIGGQVSSPSQSASGVSSGVVFAYGASHNIVSGVSMCNPSAVPKIGAYAVKDESGAGTNLVTGCAFGPWATSEILAMDATSSVSNCTGLPTSYTVPSGPLANLNMALVPEDALVKSSSLSPIYGLTGCRMGRTVTITSTSGVAAVSNIAGTQFLKGGVDAAIPKEATLTLKCTEAGVMREIGRSF